MPDHPLLLFSTPTKADRDAGHGGGSPLHRPSLDRQRQRMGPKLATLNQAFDARRLTLQQFAPAENPELVLVIETIGSVANFAKAVRRVTGLEWLVESDEDGIPPDEDFYDEKSPGKNLSGQLFMLATNRQALDELLSLWNRYQADPNADFARGLAPFKHVFAQLKDIRPWGIADRVGQDVRAYWQDQLDEQVPSVRFEVEAWYFASAQKNDAARQEISARVHALNGQIIASAIISEIGYHGLLVELPAAALVQILAGQVPELVLSDRVMYFRPKAQSIADVHDEGEVVPHDVNVGEIGAESPVVALLDGLPLQNHPLLAGRLIVDDPDGWEASYEAKDRVHGTAMASLILRGELDGAAPPASRSIYVRPVLRPDPTDTFHARRVEHTPDDVLLMDLMHRSVKRICEGEAGEGPVAPTVRVINLSIGDETRVFDRAMSPWARLLDWLSFKYGVLFVVSAGNAVDTVRVATPQGTIGGMSPAERKVLALDAVLADGVQRRLISPAESINSMTVGATNVDLSTPPVVADRFDIFDESSPNPISRIGHGFRRAIKPDVLMPGGRNLLREKLVGGVAAETTLEVVTAKVAPGHRVAYPPLPGDAPNSTAYVRGTSNAAALTSRAAVMAFDVLQDLRASTPAVLPATHDGVLLKALLAHGASWGPLAAEILGRRSDVTDWRQQKGLVARWIGYGPANVLRALECTAERATLVGTGELAADEALVFAVPLPPSLAGKAVFRRLTVTLAWFSPGNAAHRTYRRAKLWLTPPQTELAVKRTNSVYDKAAQRGTLQHEILEGEDALAYVDGAKLECKVNCAADAGELTHKIRFALCLTIEVQVGVGIPIYQEIRARIAPQVQVQPTPP
jgi:subtilisin family serine protease